MIGGDYYSDIAIDDVMIQNGLKCEDASPGPNDCDFEIDLCSWHQEISRDDIDWDRVSNAINPNPLGPPADHTRGDETGYYMMVAESTNFDEERARLVSNTIQNTDDLGACMEFWYHMDNTYDIVLKVLKWIMGPSDDQEVKWQKEESRGPGWHQVYIHFTEKQLYTITFEATRDFVSDGAVAIDDITLNDGICPMPNKCDFENGDCNYSPGAGTDFFWTVVQANSGDPVPSKDVSYNSGAGK
ncbi:MAM and LDL-receptor class A domain-containing protein 1-like [Lytechinus variegatus]|uniref:MAM and LDL-receptor class A domain-containing protein 1-like n=1 Tax=Lytechinus variegatus TaxID=7654 RepID=UPI001BB25C3A|nr:MAM and LDL-receptor class A domain-containing protein 1-like [Lytechinus variegatus]